MGQPSGSARTLALVSATSPGAGGLPAGISVDEHGSACSGWARQGLSSSVPGKCVKPPYWSTHAGVWVCHSPVSKLISGSLTRGIKSRSHNGIHSSSCPGKEQAPTARWGWARPRWPVLRSPMGVPAHAHPPPCHGTRLALEPCPCEWKPRKMPNAGCHKVFPSQGTSAMSAGPTGVTKEG